VDACISGHIKLEHVITCTFGCTNGEMHVESFSDGVDYEEDDIKDDGDEDAPYRYEAEQDENMEYDHIDPEEVDDLN
jgi:hypothetical protein